MVVCLDEISEFLLELDRVLDKAELVDPCCFGAELASSCLIGFPVAKFKQILVFSEILIILRELVEQHLDSILSLFHFVEFDAGFEHEL